MISKIVAIIGPTASGKSALAVRLAQKFGGEVISADSRQVYNGLDVGSGKLEVEKRKGIKHHLLDVASPRRIFTVVRYKKLAEKAIVDIMRRGKLPIFCGGTGFYLDAVLSCLSIPPVPPNAKLRRRLEKLDDRQLFRELERLDPERAKNIDWRNRRRLIRAIEVAAASPKGSTFSCQGRTLTKQQEYFKIGIWVEKNKLRRNINKGLKERMKFGLVAEVKQLHRQGLSWRRLNDLGLDCRHVSRYLRRQLTKEKMVQQLQTAIWHYAKRQMTWFKRDSNIHWVKTPVEAERLTRDFLQGSLGKWYTDGLQNRNRRSDSSSSRLRRPACRQGRDFGGQARPISSLPDGECVSGTTGSAS